MQQQVNLYQLAFHEQRQILSSATVAPAILAVITALLVFYGYAVRQVSQLEMEVASVRTQAEQQTAAVSTAEALRPARANPVSLQGQLKRVNTQIAERTRALEVLRTGAAGERGGFASRLEALARRHVDGIWLTHIVFASGAGLQSLTGTTTNPDLVPRYLQGFAAEPALAGTRFDAFRLGQTEFVDDAVVDKELESSAKPGSLLRFRVFSAADTNRPPGSPL